MSLQYLTIGGTSKLTKAQKHQKFIQICNSVFQYVKDYH